MTPLRHAALALSYVALAAALAVALALAAGIGAPGAAGVAAAAILAGALAHLALAGRGEAAALRAEIAGLRERQAGIEKELTRARDEARQIHAALADAGRAGGGLKQVMAEVDVLQRLVEQLRERQETAVPPPPAAGPVHPPVAPPAAPPAVPPGPPRERTMLDTVREALSAGRVDLVIQPIVALPQRRRRFYECFARMRDETGAVLLPEQYLDVAAREGLAPAIDNLLLFRCIQTIRRVRQRSAGIGFFCNIAPHSLADSDFLRDFGDFLDQNRDLAANLILEMAQDSLDLHDGELKAEMDRLAGLGLRFSLDHVDDLALDYARLAEWHVRFVKIPADRFAAGESDGREDSPFQLRRMLGLHGIDLIVERIETDRQLLELLEFNIAYGQGPLFGAPKPAPEG